MKNLTDLFRIVELTRAQIQYGYVLNNLKPGEASNLAEHHYLVTFIAWQLARYAKSQGGNLDVERIIEYGLIHDLGELLGGDISRPYVDLNRKARTYAKAFEAENQKFLGKFFGEDKKHYLQLSKEMMNPNNDNAQVFKVADYMECAHFLRYMGYFNNNDERIVATSIPKMVNRIKDKPTKKALKEFVTLWLKEIKKSKTTVEVLQQTRKK